MRYELNVNEEITRNRQNHSLLPNRIYLPGIKSNGYNKMDFETLKFMKATIFFKFAHVFVFIGGVIYLASLNVSNG